MYKQHTQCTQLYSDPEYVDESNGLPTQGPKPPTLRTHGFVQVGPMTEMCTQLGELDPYALEPALCPGQFRWHLSEE